MEEYKLAPPADTWSPFKFFYCVNSFVAQVNPKALEVRNSGSFHCTETKGFAHYLLKDQAFQRELLFSPERSSASWLIYDEAEGTRSWAIEMKQNKFQCWAIWYQDQGGENTFFQQTTQVTIPV
jgi:hypothetical protein